MTNLTTKCFSIQNGKVVTSILADFSHYIESTTRPTGIGYTYYTTTVEREIEPEQTDDEGSVIKAAVIDDVWALVKWVSWSGPERIIQTFENEQAANAAAEASYVHDILNNPELSITTSEQEANEWLAECAV